MFTVEPEIPWRIDYGFNMAVDFCIWVLELDGLQIPPFEQHSQGNSILQSIGLDIESWRKWIATVVALQDPILLWNRNCQNQQLWIEEQLTAYNTMNSLLIQHSEWSNQQINLADLGSTLTRHYASYQHQYQSATALVNHVPGTPEDYKDRPANVFPGLLGVRELLLSLWQSYELLWEQERVNGRMSQVEQIRLTGENNKLWQNIEYLNIYLVNYPVPVEYLVPPVSVIVSFANELLPQSDIFNEFVLRTAMRLVESNS